MGLSRSSSPLAGDEDPSGRIRGEGVTKPLLSAGGSQLCCEIVGLSIPLYQFVGRIRRRKGDNPTFHVPKPLLTERISDLRSDTTYK
jgi:hypothetical protein